MGRGFATPHSSGLLAGRRRSVVPAKRLSAVEFEALEDGQLISVNRAQLAVLLAGGPSLQIAASPLDGVRDLVATMIADEKRVATVIASTAAQGLWRDLLDKAVSEAGGMRGVHTVILSPSWARDTARLDTDLIVVDERLGGPQTSTGQAIASHVEAARRAIVITSASGAPEDPEPMMQRSREAQALFGIRHQVSLIIPAI